MPTQSFASPPVTDNRRSTSPPAKGLPTALAMAAWLVLCHAPPAQAQSQKLTAEEAVRLAIERDPNVLAARSRLEGAAAGVRSARAPFNPQGEVAPGVGFTNGTALLSQQIDIGGRRSAQAKSAEGLRGAAAAELGMARLQAAATARAAYFDLVRARASQGAATDAAGLARQVRDAVRRRFEIGESPQVQVTRAEIEVGRAEQEVARASGEARSRVATLNLLLGRPASDAAEPSDPLAIPPKNDPQGSLIEQAERQRPELAAARALVEARRGEVAVAKSQRRPELFAEVASDLWSLDRDPFNSRNLGFQARLSFPLFDRGRVRGLEEQARAGVKAQEAELAVTRRAIGIEVERAAAELEAAREVALNYESTILPQTQDLLKSTRSGFDIGLTSFLEVLDAQRLARTTQTEYLKAVFDAVSARIALDRALGSIPGLAPEPSATPLRTRK
jgi:outer membrane protein, heavy metal efflux system